MDVTQHTRFLANPIALAASAELRANAAANASRIRELETILHSKRRELARLHSTKRLRATSITPPPSACITPLTSSPRTIDYVKNTPREMAARGSHWSFAEKARFEAALHRYGPFAWDHIIRAVATRSDKQVKAYAARYRRRKKLAAKAQQEAVRAFAAAQLNAAAAAAAAAAANHSLTMYGRAPRRELPKSEHRLAPIMPADFRSSPGVHVRSPDVTPFSSSLSAFGGADADSGAECAPPSPPSPPPVRAAAGACEQACGAALMSDADDGTDADAEAEACATEPSVVESSSNADTDDALFADAHMGGDGLVRMMRAASEEMTRDHAERQVSLECTLLRDSDDWTLADSLSGELLHDALLAAPL